MSNELKDLLAPEAEIPWAQAAAFFAATKEASIDKEAAPKNTKENPAIDAAKKGVLSGIRSSAHQDVTHAQRVSRTRGTRVGKELGTLGGAAAGFMAGKAGGVPGRIAGTAIGALAGRGVGKSVGEEVDRARTVSRYKRKKAEIEKTSVSRVRELWKIAQGEAVEGAEGATPAPGAVDAAGLQQDLEQGRAQKTPAQTNIVRSGGPTPEELERLQAEEQLEQEMMLDQVAAANEADHYRQVAEQAQALLGEAQQQAQMAGQEAQQAQQQAQMSQQQADMASEQLTQQAQQSAAEKEQLTQESVSARDTVMRMRQAMQSYRENLQQLALQDPVAMAGPTPEDQGMEDPAAMAASGEAAKQIQEAQQADQEAQQQAAQAQQANANDQAKMQAAEEQAAAQQEAAMQGQVKQSSARGERRKIIAESTRVGAAAGSRAAGMKGLPVGAAGGYLVGKEIADRRYPMKKKAAADRAVGAAIGAATFGGLQALTDRGKPGQMSEKERMLRSKLQHYQQKKNPSVFDKHMRTITRAMADTATINRQHPGSAAAMAAITGSIAGAALAPTAMKLVRR